MSCRHMLVFVGGTVAWCERCGAVRAYDDSTGTFRWTWKRWVQPGGQARGAGAKARDKVCDAQQFARRQRDAALVKQSEATKKALAAFLTRKRR